MTQPKPARSARRPSPKAPEPAVPEPRPARADAAGAFAPHGHPVVGIGASAGGFGAFQSFFSAVPQAPTGMAFVVVQHLAPDYRSLLAELLGRFTWMTVQEAADDMPVRPDNVYVIPPDRDMLFGDGRLHLFAPLQPRGLRTTIDAFFRSLAEELGEEAICIVLSGTGHDGTQGVRMVKGAGGMAMAQSPESSEYDGMPRNAIATGLVDFVLPPEEMPKFLMSYAQQAIRPKTLHAPPRAGSALRNLFQALQARTGHDFSGYKEGTVIRRVERRMALHRRESLEDYVAFLQGNPEEVESLFHDLLIGVTSFFRDPLAFSALREKVIPQLFSGKAPGDPVRVWVCGCSTGEEAYSVAILLREYLDAGGLPHKAQVFATDIDPLAIDVARKGAYAGCHAPDLPKEILSRRFIPDPETGTLHVQPIIRDMLIFSEQNVVKDPPLSRMDLITCRNLLIYMNPALQKKAITLFHYALNQEGYLFLGAAESVGEPGSLFLSVDRKAKIYQRRDGLSKSAGALSLEGMPALQGGLRPRAEGPSGDARPRLKGLMEQALLNHFLLAAILVNARGDILHILGRTGPFLEPAPGAPTLNIQSMAREGLRRHLEKTLHHAVHKREVAQARNLLVKHEGGLQAMNLTVRPIVTDPTGHQAPELFLVVFEPCFPEEAPGPQAGPPPAPPGETEARLASLEQELRAKDEYIQTALEEMGTSHEELRSVNEELQSINEEMGATNEELETSKEELQSVNEELTTVNTELQIKLSELSTAYTDMNNLLSGTGVGILVVDRQARISRFTPVVTNLLSLIPADVGRPVAHFASNLDSYQGLAQDVEAVLRSLAPLEVEVRARNGAWYLVRIRPYRTLEEKVEGVVITCVDITDRKEMQADIEVRKMESRMLEALGVGFFQADQEKNVVELSPQARELLGLPPSAPITWEALADRMDPEVADLFLDRARAPLEPAVMRPFHGQGRVARGWTRECLVLGQVRRKMAAGDSSLQAAGICLDLTSLTPERLAPLLPPTPSPETGEKVALRGDPHAPQDT